MARTLIPVTDAPGEYSHAGTIFTWTAGDSVNNNAFVLTGGEIVLARNTHATVNQTVTIVSSATPFGRTKDITTFTIAFGAFALFGPFPRVGWQQADGRLWLNPSDATVQFLIIKP